MQAPIEPMRHNPNGITMLRFFLHLSLMACAALLLLTRPTMLTLVREESWAPHWLFLGPVLFTLIFLILVIERFVAHGLKLANLADLFPAFFGLAVIATLISSALIEYRARRVDEEIGINFIKTFSHHQDARVRALALLALASHNFYDQQAIALIHAGLLDKDPLVQHAAKLVIEDTLGIRFKNGSEGTGQAKQLMRDAAPSALLMRKGTP